MKNSLFMMRNAISYSMTYNKLKRFIFKSFLIISFKNNKYKDLQIKCNDDHRVDKYLLDINNIINKSIEEIVLRFNEYNDYLEYNFKEVVKKPCYLKVIYFDDTYDIFNLKFR